MKIKRLILDILFPIRCISCGKYEQWICEKCFKEIKIIQDQTCPICKKIFTPNGKICFSCKEESPLDGILVASFYRENKRKTLLAEMIHYYKYRFISEIGHELAKILEKSIINSSLPIPDLILAVPLHKRRLRWRGFNQSLIMALHLGENLTPGFPIKVLDGLILRNRDTKPQVKIKNKFQRKTNVRDAFVLNSEILKQNSIKGINILLVDDVATTGSTLLECAKVLKKHGTKKVYSVVLARQ